MPDPLGLKILLYLHEQGPDSPESMRTRLLGERVKLGRELLERLLAALEEEGLVRRSECMAVRGAGGRGPCYALTREGVRLAEKTSRVLKSLESLGVVRPSTLLLLNPLHMYILLHLRMACTDYAKSIARIVKTPVEDVVLALDRLEELGLVERVHGSALKRTEAKLKLSYEVRKHHTYYRLSRGGEAIVRGVRRHGLLEKWLELITGCEKAYQLLRFLDEAGHEHIVTVAQRLSMRLEEAQRLVGRLVELGLVAETKPKVLKMRHRRAKPKKETRCLHKYYRLTRLAELLMRYSTRVKGG